MRRKKGKAISVVSMSFLDLLSCALGAVLLLDIVFSQTLRPGHSTETTPFAAVEVTQSISVDAAKRDELFKRIVLSPNDYLQGSLTLQPSDGIPETIVSQFGREGRQRLCDASWANPKVSLSNSDDSGIEVQWTVVLTFLTAEKGCVTASIKPNSAREIEFEAEFSGGRLYWHKGTQTLDENGCFTLESLSDLTSETSPGE